jgi:hypothetical protein
MTRLLILVLALLVRSATYVPASPEPAEYANPSAWTIGPIIGGQSYSPGMPLRPRASSDGWWEFDFPQCGGPPGPQGRGRSVNYVTVPPRLPLTGSMTVTFDIVGDAVFAATEGRNPRLRLYFQRRGDDWSGVGPMSGYRWFSRPADSVPIQPGRHTLTVPFNFDRWGGVETAPTRADFDAARQQVEAAGMVFGGDQAAGHGVCLTSGSARLIVREFFVGR